MGDFAERRFVRPSARGGMPGENMVRLVDAERAGASYARARGSSIEELRNLPADKCCHSKRQRGLGGLSLTVGDPR